MCLFLLVPLAAASILCLSHSFEHEAKSIIEEDTQGISKASTCSLYLAPSKLLGAGRGVFAGKDFKINDVVEDAPGLFIPQSTSERTQLNNYVYAAEEEDYSMIVFGPAVLYNHNSNQPSVAHQWRSTYVIPQKVSIQGHFSNSSFIEHYAVKNISTGQEIFFRYTESGDTEEWFDARGISILEHSREDSIGKEGAYTLEELTDLGVCLSDIAVRESTIPDSGAGLFAEVPFSPGQLISVSPALLLEKSLIEEVSSDSLFINYCIGREDVGYLLFPLGLPAMINNAVRREDVNVRMELRIHDRDAPVHELAGSQFSRVDILYLATKEVPAGGELLLDYGEKWRQRWEDYMDQLESVLSTVAEGYDRRDYGIEKLEEEEVDKLLSQVSFRHHIEAPDGLMPDIWLAANNPVDDRCFLYLAPSALANRGVFAGKGFRPNQLLSDNAPVIAVPKSVMRATQLNNYVFNSEEQDYSIVILGPASMFNHHQGCISVYSQWQSAHVTPIRECSRGPYSDCTGVDHFASKAIEEGQEVFSSYTDDTDHEHDWFRTRGVAFSGSESACTARYTSDQLKLLECLTDVVVGESAIPGAGNGLLRRRATSVGEVVAVSPALTLKRGVIDTMEDEDKLILNYCIGRTELNYLLLPIGLPAVINHATRGLYEPNVRIELRIHDDSEEVETDREANVPSMEELSHSAFSRIDIVYIATREIGAGEEILMDYGETWQRRWDDWLNEDAIPNLDGLHAVRDEDPGKPPLFRQYIEAPADVFPSVWLHHRASASDSHDEL